MKNMRRRGLLILVAVFMFTSTWAGVFGLEADQQSAEASQQGQDQVQLDENAAPEGDVQGVEETAEPEINTLKATEDPVITVTNRSVSNKTIAGSWTSTVPGEPTYKVEVYLADDVNAEDGTIREGAVVQASAEFAATDDKKYKFSLDYDTEYIVYVTAKVGDTETYYKGWSEKVYVDQEMANVSELQALSGFNAVKLEWKPVKGALKYKIKRKQGSKSWTVSASSLKKNKENGKVYFINGYQGKGSVEKGKTYKYSVRAIRKTSQSPYWKSDSCHGAVKKMTISVTLKKNRVLKAIDGSGARLNYKRGKTILTDGYGGGCYYFKKNGHQFRMNRLSAMKQKAHYIGLGSNTWDYSRDEAEFFVQGFCKKLNVGSKTSYLMWTSFYTQHIYLFHKDNGRWECIDDWHCGTGRAVTPSPTGTKEIGNKSPYHHNLKWWSSFTAEGLGNSFHSKYSGDRVGQTLSHGCIRNPVEKAKKVYDNCARGTRVINF